ncbi:hypothetical protein [Butyrivibrio fibrisolvens]|nr:hypothetical protein [Butyrivibrio fibrisolvens]
MLERSVNGERESYVYDNNVVSMSKAGDDYFYMLDELHRQHQNAIFDAM